MSQADAAWRRVLYDASVWVSAVAYPGSVPDQAVELARTGVVQSIISEALIAQVRRTLLGPRFGRSTDAVRDTELSNRTSSAVVTPTITLSVITAKESDNRVLECAVAGGADVIVTGDRKHLLRLGHFQGIPIVSPRDFIASFVEES